MREQIAKILYESMNPRACISFEEAQDCDEDAEALGITDQILALFRAEISKLKPLSDEHIKTIFTTSGTDNILDIELGGKWIAQAQLDSIKKALLDKLGGK